MDPLTMFGLLLVVAGAGVTVILERGRTGIALIVLGLAAGVAWAFLEVAEVGFGTFAGVMLTLVAVGAACAALLIARVFFAAR